MDETLRNVLIGVGALLGLLIVVGLGLYVADYGAGATIVGKGSDDGGDYIIAETDLGGKEIKRYLPRDQWTVVQEGFYVVYHIRSGDTEVYTEKGGQLIWESG